MHVCVYIYVVTGQCRSVQVCCVHSETSVTCHNWNVSFMMDLQGWRINDVCTQYICLILFQKLGQISGCGGYGGAD